MFPEPPSTIKDNMYTSVMSLLYKTITRVYIIHQCHFIYFLFFCSLTLLVLSIITSTMMLYSIYIFHLIIGSVSYHIYIYIPSSIFTLHRAWSLWQQEKYLFCWCNNPAMEWHETNKCIIYIWIELPHHPGIKTFVHGYVDK